MPTGRLLLTPDNPFARLDGLAPLVELLTDCGLTGEPLAGRDGRYLSGPRFLQLLSFMGCSPHLEFTPAADGGDDFAHLHLHRHEHMQLLTGENTAPPRCPACRARLGDWREAVAGWQIDDAGFRWPCPRCGEGHHPAALDWRQNGGGGRLFIDIYSVYPGEAVPVDGLFARLRELGLGKWRYFYLR